MQCLNSVVNTEGLNDQARDIVTSIPKATCYLLLISVLATAAAAAAAGVGVCGGGGVKVKLRCTKLTDLHQLTFVICKV